MVIQDYEGRLVRLPEERWQHICEAHPEMATMMHRIREALEQPDRLVIPGDETEMERRYYKRFANTIVGDKWMRVAVIHTSGDSFITTAFLTSRVK